MSVIVRGMEMPTNCFLCPLSVLNENRLFCEVTKNEVLRAKIDAECPLVPVPPHGDLIERDKLREVMFIGEQCLYSWDEIEDAIDYAPTIIPAEESE